MVNAFVLIFLLSSMAIVPGGRCSKLEKTDSKVSKDNAYLDEIIQRTIDENRDDLEPYRPENLTFTFEHKVMFITFKREVSLYNLQITGLTTVHREGDCERKNKHGISTLSANLGMGILEFDSKATVKVMKLGPTFRMHGEIGYLLIHLEITQNNTAGTPPKVKKLEVYDQKGLDVKVSEMGPLSKFTELIIKAGAKLFKGKVNSKFEEKLKELLDKKLVDEVFPIHIDID